MIGNPALGEPVEFVELLRGGDIGVRILPTQPVSAVLYLVKKP
jgi:hypothetical protein